ncbi:MAG: GNAT family N-acetyltransferase, partial [Burkholderiaceae bacterium]
ICLPVDAPYQAWYFGDTPALAHELVELVLHGPKRATAGLAEFNDLQPDAKPISGGYSVVTELNGTPRAVIRTTSVERRAFRDVDAAFAWDEGEGDRTLADWKEGHRRFFSREMGAAGRTFDEGMLVDLERFELLHPFDAAMNPVDCGPRIVPACLPGGLLESAELQIDYYARRHGFGPAFASERRQDIARFLDEHDGARDGVWLLIDGGRVRGSVVIDCRGVTPELRWFIVDEALIGQGWGRRLLACALDWCARRHPRVVLHTFSALADARRLYEAFGFVQIGNESSYSGYGPTIVDQDFEWRREARQSGTIGT